MSAANETSRSNDLLGGRLWSAFRAAILHGTNLQMEYQSGNVRFPTYGHLSAEIDASASRSADSLEALLESLVWQPIETAPFDQSVFVWCPVYGRYLAYREQLTEHDDVGQWCNWSGEKGLLPPKYWTPMPSPPNAVHEATFCSEGQRP